jgi:hypothetical protein
VEVLSRKVAVTYPDGSDGFALVECAEEETTDAIYLKIKFDNGQLVESFSDISLFDALRKARLQLEESSVSLLCYGSDERVYPSPMQQAMGVNTLAYRNKLGKQATSADIVDIFSYDDSVVCATVKEQESFHANWLRSLQI